MFLLPQMSFGGIQKNTLRLLKYLNKADWRPVLVVAEEGGDLKQFIPEEIPVYTLGLRPGKKISLGLIRLQHLLRRIGPDILVGMGASCNRLSCLSKALNPSIRVIVSERGTFTFDEGEKGMYPLRRMISRFLYRMSDSVMCVSKGVKDDLVETLKLDPSRTYRSRFGDLSQ